MAIIDWLESDRPRERLITQGLDKLSDAELLVNFLFYRGYRSNNFLIG